MRKRALLAAVIVAGIVLLIGNSTRAVRFEHAATTHLVDGAPAIEAPATLRIDEGAFGALLVAHGGALRLSLIDFGVDLDGRLVVEEARLVEPEGVSLELSGSPSWEAFQSSAQGRSSTGALHVLDLEPSLVARTLASKSDLTIELRLSIDGQARVVPLTFRQRVTYWPPSV